MIIFLEKLSSYIWGGGLIFLLLVTGAIYTVKLGFIQFKTLPYLIKNSKREINPIKKVSLSGKPFVCRWEQPWEQET